MFGEQSDVHPVLNGRDLPPVTSTSYLEFILAVPYVRERGTKNGPFLHFLRLFLDDPRAVVAGWYYGYPKLLAELKSSQTEYRVRSFSAKKTSLVSATFARRDRWDQEAFELHLALLGPIFTQPIISKRGLGFSCSRFDWHLDQADAFPIEAQATIESEFLEGLAPVAVNSEGLDRHRLGSFRMTTRWSLGTPLSCAGL